MEAEELVFYDGSEGEEVEEFCQTFPDVGVVVFSAAFMGEAVERGDLS